MAEGENGLSESKPEISLQQNSEHFYSQTSVPIWKPKESPNKEYIVALITKWADYYDYPDIKKAEAIVSCEGGFETSTACNGQYGCAGGQGHFQFIPSTWSSMQGAIGVQDVFDSSDNIQAGIYLLKTSGDHHWGSSETWWGSYRCWNPKIAR